MSKYNWISSTRFKGVRYHQHSTKKHGVQYDKLFGIRYQLAGKRYENILGWSSEGWNEAKAALELTKLKEEYRLGNGAVSLSEKRIIAKVKQEEERKKHEEEEKRLIKFSTFFEENYFPTQMQKSDTSRSAERGMYTNWIYPVIGEKPLVDITPLDIEQIKQNMLNKKRSTSTINYVFAVISQVWSLAKRDEYVFKECPIKKVTLPKKDNTRERFLTKAEVNLLLERLQEQTPQSHDMALVALYCGLRFSEIANLEWSCVNFETNTLLIKDPKSKKNRVAYITASVLEMLQSRHTRLLEKDILPHGLIFSSTKGDVMKSVSKVYRLIVDELFNQNVTDSRQKVCFHTLRHTFASWLVQKGVDLYSVKELMGHADFKMTQRYSHLSPDGLRKAVEVLE